MKLNVLKPTQEKLDRYIFREHNTNRNQTRENRTIALFVEWIELYNLTKDHKYWSKSIPNRNKILEEYVDCIHFCLSLAYDYEIDLTYTTKSKTKRYKPKSLNQHYKTLIELHSNTLLNPTKTTYKNFISHIVNLGRFFNFTEEEVINAYMEKNKINYERQKENY